MEEEGTNQEGRQVRRTRQDGAAGSQSVSHSTDSSSNTGQNSVQQQVVLYDSEWWLYGHSAECHAAPPSTSSQQQR